MEILLTEPGGVVGVGGGELSIFYIAVIRSLIINLTPYQLQYMELRT